MSSLGTASLALVVNGQQFNIGLKQSEKQVEGWASRVGSKIKGVGGKMMDGLVKGLGAGVGFAAANLGIDSIGNMLSGGIEKLKELRDVGEYAQALGTTGEEMSKLSGLARYAGTDIKQIMEGMATFNKMISEAGKGGEADKLFAGLNMEAKEFQGLNAHDQFFKLFSALEKVEDPMQRFQLLMGATGEDVGKLMAKLTRFSGSELTNLANGFSVSNNEIAQATVATESLEQAQLKLEQAAGRIAVAFAPVVSIIADQLTDAVNGNQNAFTQFGNVVLPICKNIAYFVANIVDVMRGLGNVIQVSISGWTMLGGKIWETLGKVTGNKQQEAEGKKIFEDAMNSGNAAFDRLKNNAWDVTNALGGILEMKLDTFDKKVAAVEKRLANPPKPRAADIKQAEELAIKPYDAIIAASKEAARAQLRWNAGIPLEDVPKQQLKEQQKMNANLKDINQNIKGNKLVLGVK